MMEKNKLTKNLGLKIVSIIAAFLMWLVVVNVDDPVISRTYSGVQVELMNTDVLTSEGKCFEVLEGTDTVNVVVTAKRSVVDEMSRDDIRATADFNSLTIVDSVPIEVRCTRYSDKIDSVTTRTGSVKLKIENIVERIFPISVISEGKLPNGYVLAGVELDRDNVIVKGPESSVEDIAKVITSVDISGLESDATVSKTIEPCDSSGREIRDTRVVIENPVVQVSYYINTTKEIPVVSGYSGNPAIGFAATGTVITNPSSVLITGRGENYEDMDVIYISPDIVSIEGAVSNVMTQVDISDYLPTGVEFADADLVPNVNVEVAIDSTERKTISVPTANITVENIPEGYIANVVDTGGSVDVEIQGLGDTFDRYSGDLAIGIIDALALVPRNVNPEAEGAPVQTGENDGTVIFDLPNGISIANPVNMLVIVDYVGITEVLSGENQNHDAEGVTEGSAPDANGDESAEDTTASESEGTSEADNQNDENSADDDSATE